MEAKYAKDGDVDIVHAHTMRCVGACSGLDMSDVPEGAVGELVEALRWNMELSVLYFIYDNTGFPPEFFDILERAKQDLDAALAPFVKE